MIRRITNFCHKTVALFHHLLAAYAKPHFELLSIDTSPILESCLVHFLDNKTGNNLSKNLKDLFKNKTLLKYFSSGDAAQIGYSYGKIIAKDEE